jgi:hypothetical protein
VFARAVQLCTITGTVWAFLDGVKQTGSPLPRHTIVLRCLKDATLLATLCHAARMALQLAAPDDAADRGGNGSQGAHTMAAAATARSAMVTAGASRIVSFVTATVIEVADRRPMDDAKIRALYPFLMDGLRVPRDGAARDACAELWGRSACMVLAQVCRKTQLARPVLKSVVGALMQLFVHVSGVGDVDGRERATAGRRGTRRPGHDADG